MKFRCLSSIVINLNEGVDLKIWKLAVLVFFLGGKLAMAEPLASYPFNGSTADVSGNTLEGVERNGVTFTDDRFGTAESACAFDGVDDNIVVAPDPLLEIDEEITLAAWIMPAEQKTQTIIRKGGSARKCPYSISTSGTGDLVFGLTFAGDRASQDPPRGQQLRIEGYALDQWSFVVGTYDGAAMRLYVNGQLEATRKISGTIYKDGNPLLIGTRLALPSSTFDGAIDEVRVYDYALSAEEIAQSMSAASHEKDTEERDSEGSSGA